jgi:hypothetical protein
MPETVAATPLSCTPCALRYNAGHVAMQGTRVEAMQGTCVEAKGEASTRWSSQQARCSAGVQAHGPAQREAEGARRRMCVCMYVQAHGDTGNGPVGRAVDRGTNAQRTLRVLHGESSGGRVGVSARVSAVHVSNGRAVVAASRRLRHQAGSMLHHVPCMLRHHVDALLRHRALLCPLLHRLGRLHRRLHLARVAHRGRFGLLARFLGVFLGLELLELGFHQLHVCTRHEC